ncbi:MAG: glycosyltransferase family 39 protein [Gemmatimonadota bacterium]
MRKFVGTSDDALMIACTALASTLIYLAASSYLRLELNAVSYRLQLFRSYYEKFGWPDLFPAAVSGVGLIQLVILGTVCAIFGLLVRWLFYPGSGGGLVVLVYGFAAALVPPLFVAAVLWPDGQGRLGTLALLALSVGFTGVLALAFIRRLRARAREAAQIEATTDVERSRFRFLVLVPLLPLMALVWWCGVSALQGFDSWSYHVPLAAHWLTDSSLYRGPEVSLTDFYPGNFELLVRWLLALGSPNYVFVVALIGGVLSVYVIYRICLELEHTETAALIAAACAGSCAVMVNLMATAYSDTMASLFTLVAVFLLLRWLRTREPVLLVALGTSLGLAAGTKYTALPVAVLIVATVAWHLLPSVKAESNSTPIRGLTALLLAAVICSGYWYIRNAIEHGNPVFRVGMVALPGVSMDYLVPPKPGLPASPLHYLFLPWREFGFTGRYYDDGIGLMFAAIALPAFILMPMLDSWRSRRPAVALWLITVVLFAQWLSTGSLYARFGLIPILLTGSARPGLALAHPC